MKKRAITFIVIVAMVTAAGSLMAPFLWAAALSAGLLAAVGNLLSDMD